MNDASPPKTPAAPRIGTVELVALVAILMALNALAIDVMLPALDDIGRAMGIAEEGGKSSNRQQLIIFAYIAGFGVPQLVFGPLSDRFGRRPVLTFCLIFYTIVGALCMTVTSFAALLAARFFQGIAASGVRVVAVSVVRDMYLGRGMARIMSLVMTVFMIVPIAAPSIGQLVLFVAPWQWTFGLLVVAGILCLAWVRLRLPETLPPERRRSLDWRSALSGYGEVLANRSARGYMLGGGVIFGSLFAFIGSSEQIFTEVFRVGNNFVLWFAAVAFIMSIANFTNSSLVERFGMRRISHLALFGFITFAVTLLIAMSVFGERLFVFFPLFALVFACFGFIGANFNALAMEPLGHVAGSASAAFGFTTSTLASIIGYAIGSRYDGSVHPVIAGFVILGLSTLAIVLITERGRLFVNHEGTEAKTAPSD